MLPSMNAPPVLSTPDTRILSEIEPSENHSNGEFLSDEKLSIKYEISKTIQEIKENKWRSVALQFPDHMLHDSAAVYQMLARGLNSKRRKPAAEEVSLLGPSEPLDSQIPKLSNPSIVEDTPPTRLTILADTSYGSCCVDEIAAEHVNAEAIIHYGRACLSPTSRLPVVYIYTTEELDIHAAIEAFQSAYPEQDKQVIVTADVPYASHVQQFCELISNSGYKNVFPASIIHNPSSMVPNRTVPDSVESDPATLKDWHLFHISGPPTSLLLALASRVASIRVLSTSHPNSVSSLNSPDLSTASLLRRRYALITSLTTVAVWGILINTLSVKNYMQMVDHVKDQLRKSGKKSYMFVVGKVNAAKVANFSEIGGWVVIGCWESSLIDSKDFYKPIITPFELDLALQPDNERIWTGDWRSDFQGTFDAATKRLEPENSSSSTISDTGKAPEGMNDIDSEEESEPPEFDLRTGRYVSRSRPMRSYKLPLQSANSEGNQGSSHALTRLGGRELINSNSIGSPAAEYLAHQRNWRGLGSDFEIKYEDEEHGAAVEEGLSGVPRAYAVGESDRS